MVLAVLIGDFAGASFGMVLAVAIIGIPISVALVRNHRYAEATKNSHMWGWVPGNPDTGRVHELMEVPPSPYGTLGPRIVHEERTGYGKRVWIVAGEPAPRANLTFQATPTVADMARPADRGLDLIDPVDTTQADIAEDFDAIFETDDPPDAVPLTPEVRVLGRVEIVGWREEPERKVVPELVCFLALHSERRVPGEEIRAALWPGDLETTEASVKSLHNAVSMLRKCLGAEYISQASKGSGYRLSTNIRSDWSRFCELVERSKSKGEDEIELMTRALKLVRGAPFEGVAPGSYNWAWTELFVPRIEVAVAEAATRLGTLAFDLGDQARARWAAIQGLMVTPYERSLWKVFLLAASASGSGELDRAVSHATSVLGDDIHDLDDLIEGLRTRT